MKPLKDHAMQLLDRYLVAVRKHLPWQRQDDIVAELRANLEAQLEEKEATLGRPLTAAEAEAWIKSLSSPMLMAAPYQPQQYLIGPGFFPIYRNVMRIALTWAIIIFCLANTITLVVKEPGDSGIIRALVNTLLNAPEVLLQAAAWITLVFAGLEFAVARHYVKLPDACAPFADWSTGTLPPFAAPETDGKKQPSYARAVAEVIFGIIFLIWFLLLPKHPFLWIGPGLYFVENLPFRLASVWMDCYWLLVALNIGQLIWHTINLLTGRWQKPQTVLLLVSKTIMLMAMALLLRAPGHLPVLLKHPAADSAQYGSMLNNINRSIYLSAEVICAVIALQIIWHIAQLCMETYRKRTAAI
jgi:hypothetical protein